MSTTMPGVAQTPDFQASSDYCRQVTRQQARNFYYGLRLLPEPAKSSMFALYAWMRRADDLADDSADLPLAQRRELLEQFRTLTHTAISGHAQPALESPAWPGWAAFTHCVHRHAIRPALFDDMIDGQQQDLEFHQPGNEADLQQYCYRVAGVVGVASIQIWGFTGGAATEALAVDRGMAFQLTNILRDVKEDAGRNRIYFPKEQMLSYGVTGDDLMAGKATAGFQALMQHHIALAERLFARSAPLDQRITSGNVAALTAMTAIYHGILRKIARHPQQVLRGRVRLGAVEKAWIALRCRRAEKS